MLDSVGAEGGVGAFVEHETPAVVKRDSGKPPQTQANGGLGEMMDGLNSRGSYRAFYEEALRKPEKGGVFYASKIISMCLDVKKSTAFGRDNQTPYSPGVDGNTYLLMSATSEELRAKCSMFTPEELSHEHVEAIRSSDASRKDPLLAAARDLGVNEDFGDVTKRKVLVGQVVRLADPLLISELGVRLALIGHPKTGRPVFKFGGEYYPLGSSVDVGFALYMLPCSLGMKCDRDEFDVAVKCASGTGCYAGRIAYVKEMMANGGRDFEGTMKLHDQMLEAIKNGDETKFLN